MDSARLHCPECEEVFADPRSLPEDRLGSWIALGIPPGECLYFERIGLTPAEAQAWSSAGVRFYEVPEWRRRQFSPAEAGWWTKRDVYPEDADAWRVVGLSLDDLEPLIAAGFRGPGEVAWWLSIGFDIRAAAKWRGQLDYQDFEKPRVYQFKHGDEITLETIRTWRDSGIPASQLEGWATMFRGTGAGGSVPFCRACAS